MVLDSGISETSRVWKCERAAERAEQVIILYPVTEIILYPVGAAVAAEVTTRARAGQPTRGHGTRPPAQAASS